jgi:transposase
VNRADFDSLDKASLVDLALRQAERIAELEARLAQMEQRLAEIEARMHRGAAPFARAESKRSPSPKRPGRKGGHKGVFRRRPPDEEVNQRIEVTLEQCPHCGDRLAAETDQVIEQTIIDIPPVRPEVTRLLTHRNVCRGCGQHVASSHPLQVSSACGAAGTHLEPRALALAASLNKGFGLTMRKTCAVLRDLLGMPLSPGGLSQTLARMAERLKGEDDALLKTLKGEPVLHADETSWWVGRSGFSLWVLTNQAGTCYRVVPSRSRAAAEALIGDYKGVLVSDCLNIYDGLTPYQHKCYAHHLKEIGKALDDPKARGSPYLQELRALLHGAMAVKAERACLPAAQVVRMRQALEANADRLLGAPRTTANAGIDAAPVEEKVRQRLLKQRDHLFTFLDHEAVDATNNLAERQLRPAVISRKLSCGNKTERGAKTWEVLTSLAASCRQTSSSFVDFLIPRLALKPILAQVRSTGTPQGGEGADRVCRPAVLQSRRNMLQCPDPRSAL